MKDKFRRNKEKQKSIALERIEELFKQANQAKSQGYSDRYVTLARKISSRTKTRIPLELKRRFCKHCGSYFRLGKNVRIRLNKGKKTYFCMTCNKLTRVPFK